MWRICKVVRGLRGKLWEQVGSGYQQPSSSGDERVGDTPSGKEIVNTQHWIIHKPGNAERREWRRKTFHQKHAPNLDSNFEYSLLEAFGWGTALILGLQWASLRSRKLEDDRKCIHTERDGLSALLLRSALAMPGMQHQLSILNTPGTPPPIEKSYDGKLECSKETQQDTNASEVPVSCSTEKKIDDEFAANVSKMKAAADFCVAAIQNGLGVQRASEKKPAEALAHFQAGCVLGSSKACFNLGVCYELGLGTKKDMTKAKHYYELAASKGHAIALYNLGVIYMDGVFAEKDVSKAIDYLEKAAKGGLKEAQRYMALHHIQQDEMESAFPYLQAAGDQQDTEAVYYLGVCYGNGWGVKQDLTKAANLYIKAANSGHSNATYRLAKFYETGLGDIKKDLAHALTLYQSAAATGNADASVKAHQLANQLGKTNIFSGRSSKCSVPNNSVSNEFLNEPSRTRLQSYSSSPELSGATTDPANQMHRRNNENKFSLHYISVDKNNCEADMEAARSNTGAEGHSPSMNNYHSSYNTLIYT